ncbi:MAG: hypothetical protein BWY15_01160 [Firmicutes bacterium ADurb.Bin193]|nr:MAG: hypothetical protein BWY15_01160 [Firmicutes bacterium ADurb.Bin193]
MSKRKSLIFTVAILVIIFMILSMKWKYDIERVFDVNKWEQRVEDRHKMIESLIHQYGIIGMSKHEIKALLGSNAMYQDNDEVLSYFIAYGMGDPVIFEIRFDEVGKAIGYSKYES